MRSITVVSAMACTIRCRGAGLLYRCFLVKMRFLACCMGVSSYAFCSNLPLQYLRHLTCRHTSCHRITSPAAQRQQGDHEDEEQVAHGC